MTNLINLDFSHIEDEECRKACEEARDGLLAAVPMAIAEDGEDISDWEYTGRQAVLARALQALGRTASLFTEDGIYEAGPVVWGASGLASYSLTGSHENKNYAWISSNIYNKTSARYSSKDELEAGDIICGKGSGSFSYYTPVIVINTRYVGSTKYIYTTKIDNSGTVPSYAISVERNTTSLSSSTVAINSELLDVAPYPPLDQALTNKSNYQSIADAIRERGGFTDKYYPFEMSQAILDIPGDAPNTKISSLMSAPSEPYVFDNSVVGSDTLINNAIPYARFMSSVNAPYYNDFNADFGNTTIEILPYAFKQAFTGDIDLNKANAQTRYRLYNSCFQSCRITSFRANVSSINDYTARLSEPYYPYYNPSDLRTCGIFEGCSQLKTIVFTNTSMPTVGSQPDEEESVVNLWGNNWMSPPPDDYKIYVPDNLVSQYKSNPQWKPYWDHFFPMSDL